MIAALVGLSGVIFGAIATLAGSGISDRRQTRNEERRWRRDQLANAYEQALRHLLRAANRRSEFTDSGIAVLKKEHQREWFDDLIEAEIWLRTITQYCDPADINKFQQAAGLLDSSVERMLASESFASKGVSIWAVLQSCIMDITMNNYDLQNKPPARAFIVTQQMFRSDMYSRMRPAADLPDISDDPTQGSQA